MCKEEKDSAYFYIITRKGKKVLDTYCKICKEIKSRESRRRHPETTKAKSKRYATKNKEKIKQRRKANYWNNVEGQKQKNKENHKKFREKHLAAMKKWRKDNLAQYLVSKKIYNDAHKEENSKRTKNWYKNNREYAIEEARKYRIEHPYKLVKFKRNRQIKFNNVVCTLTTKEWTWLLEKTGYTCLCCGSAGIKLEIDHIVPLDPGNHTIHNVQPLCGTCNKKKFRKTIDFRPKWLVELVSIQYPTVSPI